MGNKSFIINYYKFPGCITGKLEIFHVVVLVDSLYGRYFDYFILNS